MKGGKTDNIIHLKESIFIPSLLLAFGLIHLRRNAKSKPSDKIHVMFFFPPFYAPSRDVFFGNSPVISFLFLFIFGYGGSNFNCFESPFKAWTLFSPWDTRREINRLYRIFPPFSGGRGGRKSTHIHPHIGSTQSSINIYWMKLMCNFISFAFSSWWSNLTFISISRVVVYAVRDFHPQYRFLTKAFSWTKMISIETHRIIFIIIFYD